PHGRQPRQHLAERQAGRGPHRAGELLGQDPEGAPRPRRPDRAAAPRQRSELQEPLHPRTPLLSARGALLFKVSGSRFNVWLTRTASSLSPDAGSPAKLETLNFKL